MRVVCYAVNGSGTGHLKRLTAIARHLRHIATESGVSLEIYFLTSSEASQLLYAENFASFKFPSREALTKAGIETTEFAEIAKQWTAHTLKLLQLDLLVVDSFPAGYYDELIENLYLCCSTAVIHLLLKFDNLNKAAFYKDLARYDSIAVPEEREKAETSIPISLENKTAYFGAVICREKDELLKRQRVRRQLIGKDDDFLIYLSAGGGGNKEAERRIHFLYHPLSNSANLNFVIGAGALYQGKRIYAANVIWLTNENAFEMMPAFDSAISAAGYNSFHELLFAEVPTLFIPQDKWADDQHSRANKAAQAGAAILFKSLPQVLELQDLIEKLRAADFRRRLSQNARKFVPVNYASQIAGYLFEKFLSA